jgi:4-diphosphocytidyl-2-C-methyl-D-erythritol kinase
MIRDFAQICAMVVFPHCKINLGLYVTAKRADGFHDLETVFYPIPWCDALEAVEHPGEEPFDLTLSGQPLQGRTEDNILHKTWLLLKKDYKLPPLLVHLRKNVPTGAGLGGGSSDAAFFLRLMDEKFSLGMSPDKKLELASLLGSDCAFFLQDKPLFARGRGNEFEPVSVNLDKFYILLVHPGIHSGTAEAYSLLSPGAPAHDLKKTIGRPVSEWRDKLGNDFEKPLFARYPQLAKLKQDMYNAGALYAAMSGSGSTVFGIFEGRPELKLPAGYHEFLKEPAT